MKKKFIALLCAAGMSAALLAGCGSASDSAEPSAAADSSDTAGAADSAEDLADDSADSKADSAQAADPTDINIVALSGPTAMGMVKFMDEAESGELADNNYNFTISAAPDEVSPMIVQGTVDIAAVPGNLASVLYNKTNGGVKVIAINTLGVLYIVDNGNPVSTVADLKGRTIYASGKGSTPEYVLNYILEQNGVDPSKDVDIEWKSEHAEALSSLLADPDAVALLPQPFATVAQAKSDTVSLDLDMTEEWDKIQSSSDTDEPSALVMGVAVVRTEFADAHPEAVESFLEHYQDSVEWVNSNTEDAAKLVVSEGILENEAVAAKALPKCNITFISGDEMKTKLSGFLEVLYDQEPTAVGGALPGDDFYYGAD